MNVTLDLKGLVAKLVQSADATTVDWANSGIDFKAGVSDVLLDVREPNEWNLGRVPSAMHIPRGNLETKIEAMIQTVCTAQELYAKAALVDHEALVQAQKKGNIVDAESCLKKAFNTDVSGMIAEWRTSKGLEGDPLTVHRAGGYAERAAVERAKRRQELGIATEHSYA